MSDDLTISNSYNVIIKPNSFAGYWNMLWQYREVLYILAHRDILVRYKQTLLGLLWTIAKPLLSMIAFTIVFGKIANLPSGNIPYPVLVLSGLIPWYFFSNTLSEMSNAVVNNQSMVSKIFFPRLMLPLSTLGVGLIDLLIAFILLIGLMIAYGMALSLTLVTIPLFVFLAILSCTGIGLLFSGLNVKYRDVRIIIPFILQFGMYISPVGFSADLVPDKWRLLYSLNPMVGVIDGFRWAISAGATPMFWPGLFVSLGVTIIFLIAGLFYFRSVEKTFADVI